MQSKYRPGLTLGELFAAWGSILSGRAPMLSIEVTRECPLRCPGCYAYGDSHLGGGTTLRELSDLRGEKLVEGVLALVRKHKPLHVSLVGGEPLVRHRELSHILPELSRQGVFTLVVTSGVIPIPAEWMQLRRCRVAVSVDGLPEHHDERRKPATYARILENIRDRQVNIHWTITAPMLKRQGYLEEYVAFWNTRPEINRIWVSLYSPQVGEHSAEMLSPEERRRVGSELPGLQHAYPKLLMSPGIAEAFVTPPRSPGECLFSKMSTNYSADLTTRVEPCIFGGTPDCNQCGCVISSGLHRAQKVRVAGPLKVGHLVRGSMAIGSLRNRLRSKSADPSRWNRHPSQQPSSGLVQIGPGDPAAIDVPEQPSP
jgi:MoaA/NifB/PqqE/SkfB family radical SAM enzyme